MEKKVKEQIYWRKLDDQAKVFALASNRKYSSVFRLSVLLKDEIEKDKLKDAVILALKKYKAFKVKMRRGLFWYYFEENDEEPVIKLESEYPFKKVNTAENNYYLFKVTYFKNKINIDFFHALTDGIGGTKFLKEILYRYLELKYQDELKTVELEDKEIIKDTENAYKRSYKKNTKKSEHFSRAYKIKGEKLPKNVIGINHFNINLEDIKRCSKQTENVTLSIYLIAMLAYSIYDANYRNYEGNKPINLCVPINLSKYLETDTISNFFSYMVISLKFKSFKTYTFNDILKKVKEQFHKKLKLEQIISTISNDAGKTNNIFVRLVPLFLKKWAIGLGSLEVKRHFTMTISNIGKFEVDEKYSKYINNYIVILSPDWAEKIKCGICSFEDNLVVTFGTLLKDIFIENQFKKLLKENNIRFKIEGNGVNAISD